MWDDADRWQGAGQRVAEVSRGTASVYTGSNGRFDICSPVPSCVPRCRDIRVRFPEKRTSGIAVILILATTKAETATSASATLATFAVSKAKVHEQDIEQLPRPVCRHKTATE